MMVYELKDIAILNIKCVDYWCIIWNMNGSDTINRVYNSKIWSLMRTKHSLKTFIKEEAFRGTYFRDIYTSVKCRWYRKSWGEFNPFMHNVVKWPNIL